MADVDDLQLHLTPLQDITAHALLWLMIAVGVGLMGYQYVTAEQAEHEALEAAERLTDVPAVVYVKPYTVRILGEVYEVKRELAVPERSGR